MDIIINCLIWSNSSRLTSSKSFFNSWCMHLIHLLIVIFQSMLSVWLWAKVIILSSFQSNWKWLLAIDNLLSGCFKGAYWNANVAYFLPITNVFDRTIGMIISITIFLLYQSWSTYIVYKLFSRQSAHA